MRQQGLTLIELLIAIAITAVIGLVSAQLLSVMIANQQQVSTEKDQLLQLQRALHIIRSDLAHLAPTPPLLPSDSIVSSTSPNPLMISDVNQGFLLSFNRYQQHVKHNELELFISSVRYSIDDNTLYRESINVASAQANQFWQKTVLIQGVTEAEVQYFTDGWQNTLFDAAALRALRINITTLAWQEISVNSALVNLAVPTSPVLGTQ